MKRVRLGVSRGLVAAAASALFLTFGLPITPANASAISHGDTATPGVVSCIPPAGTIISTTATSYSESWLYTNISSSYVAGPGQVTLTQSSTSTANEAVSASFSFSASDLFTSASANYGVSVGSSTSYASSWQYTLDVPSGVTAKVQQYHEAGDLGIKVVREVLLTQSTCGTETDTSPSGNFFPYTSTAADTYCYALLGSTKTAYNEVGSGCTNNY